MPNVELHFQVKRGVVAIDRKGSGKDDLKVLDQILSLCEANQNDKAVAILHPGLSFEFDWGVADGDPDDVIEDPEHISFQLGADNSTVRVSAHAGALIVTVDVLFTINVKKGVTKESLTSWLEENSAYAAGSVTGRWEWWSGWNETDGDNLWVNAFGSSAKKPKKGS
jgi:hypothetical protein